jgi:putative spermidine/putrescine transport system permease protein
MSSRLWLRAYCALVFAFLMVPLVVVLPVSFSSAEYLQFPPPSLSLKWYERYLGSAEWIAATLRSLKIGVATSALALALGLAFASGLTRRDSRWLQLAERLMPLPVLIPSMVIAVSIYGWFSSLRLIGHWFGIVIAHTLLALPYVCIVLAAGLRAIDPSFERAARGLGASRLRAFMSITLPQLRASVATAAVFAFVISFDELIIAIFLSGAEATLPRKMFENISFAIDPTIAAVSSLQILLIFVLLVASGMVGRSVRRAPAALA